MGLHFSGVGTGIVLTEASVILLGEKLGSDGLWMLAAIACIPLDILSWMWMPKPIITSAGSDSSSHKIPWNILIIVLMIAYFLEGAAYVIDASFLVRILRLTQPLPPMQNGTW